MTTYEEDLRASNRVKKLKRKIKEFEAIARQIYEEMDKENRVYIKNQNSAGAHRPVYRVASENLFLELKKYFEDE